MQESKNQSLKPDSSGLFNADFVFSCFGPDFLDESFAKRLVTDLVCSGFPKCPFCGGLLPESENYYSRFYEGKPIKCLTCDRRFTARSQTILSGMRGKYRDLIFLCILSRIGYDSVGIANFLGVGTDWVRRWTKKIGIWKQKNMVDKIILESPEEIVSRFITNCVQNYPWASTPASDLYRSYCFWSKQNVVAPAMSQKKLGGILRKKGFKKIKAGTYKYLSIKITNSHGRKVAD